MKTLKFTLSGKTAFFKKPDVNTYLYFTYGNIHKVALLGIFGAILGYSGYNTMKLKEILNKSNKKDNYKEIFPEFYERLKNIKVSIVPKAHKGFIPKKVQSFNNSVGYASKELGGNLIVKEQWLEKPSWDIYVLADNEESEKLAEYILNNKAVYSPYLGKNDHCADICDAKLIEAREAVNTDSINRINCLFKKDDFDIFMVSEDDEWEDDDDELEENQDKEIEEDLFKYEEKLPLSLNRDTNMYEMNTFVFTNMNIKLSGNTVVYNIQGKNIVFY